jgi:hypothetical protein
MPKIKYRDWNPGIAARDIIATAEDICRTYAADGYDLTLRQLYYQFVSRDVIPNDMRSYKRLGDIINNARLAGMLDWSYIVDRTRNLRGTSHWDSPADVIDAAAQSFRLDKWETQPVRIELWVEKDALAGVIERAATEHDLSYFACRGYVSQSEQWSASQRFKRYINNGQDVVILHLGDHDPSGVDMTRDITDRLKEFIGPQSYRLDVQRIALNMDQVEQYGPPPNPAKITDSRAAGYIALHGDESWELDALDPRTLNDLITEHVERIIDQDEFEVVTEHEARHRELLNGASERWSDVVEFLEAS